MDKVYRLLDRLSPEQAIEWLTQLTGAGLDFDGLMGLCNAGHCFVYLDVTGTNITDPERGIDLELCSTDARVTGRADWGVSEFGQPYVHTATVECDAWGVYSSQDSGPDLHIAKRFNLKGRRVPFFKPLEVEALAAKMNGEDARATEIEGLRQELKCERDARKVIESELRERRAKDGSDGLENMRQMLSHTPKEFAAMQERAENAERLLAALDQQLTHLAEEKRVSDKLSMEMARQLRELSGQKPAANTETVVAGLTFPYATKELEAMRAAIAEHWEGYTLDKRQPTQKAVAFTLGELLGLPRQGNGDPARKAIVLASAIKPDTLPDA
ncbi:hypothetical protein [Pseudomonas sediminis]|uniref:hypothetical protein n=1 Tax=Pseudomonas sediminis TaxID=1691904 RepID=UPI0031CC6790